MSIVFIHDQSGSRKYKHPNKFNLFISYVCEDNHGDTQYGVMCMSSTKMINPSIYNIKKYEKFIKEREDVKNVVISNFICK